MDPKRLQAFIGLIAAKAAYCRLPTTTTQTRNAVLEAEVAFEAERILEEMKKENESGTEKINRRNGELCGVCAATRSSPGYTPCGPCFDRNRLYQELYAGTDGEI